MSVVITVRMEKHLADALALMAEKSHRSKSGLIRWLISQAVDELDPRTIKISSMVVNEENEDEAVSSE